MTNENGSGEETLPLFQPSFAEPSGSGFGDSPLLEFWGDGAGWEVKGGMSKSTPPRPWQRIYFRHANVEVLDTLELWPHPTAEISLFYSDPKSSAKRREGEGTNPWEIFSESISKFFSRNDPELLNKMYGGQVMGEGSQPEKPGLRLHWKKVPALQRVGPNPEKAEEAQKAGDPLFGTYMKWHDELVPSWMIVEIEGMGSGAVASPSTSGGSSGPSTQQKVLKLADGKSEEDFYKAALDDPEILANEGLKSMLVGRTFISGMKQAGVLTVDELGVIHTSV